MSAAMPEHHPHARPQFTCQSAMALALELGCVTLYYWQQEDAKPEIVSRWTLSEFIDEFGFPALQTLMENTNAPL